MAISSRSGLIDYLARAPYPLRQGILGAAYLMVPRRLPGLLPLAAVTLRDFPRTGRALLPDHRDALAVPDGLCGLAGRIGVTDLLAGYSRGMFALSHIGPLKWWAPKHRMVLFFDQAHIEKTTRRLLRTHKFKFTFDHAFLEVMNACADPRFGATPLTWITGRIRSLFESAHEAGYAHSVEVWENDALVGGAYGLAVGRVFFTESQFHRVRDASKVGFAVLNRHLQAWGFALNDGKHPTRYLADCGMKPITRTEFSDVMARYCAVSERPGPWNVEPSLLDDHWDPARANGMKMAEVLPTGTECPWNTEELLSTQRSPTW